MRSRQPTRTTAEAHVELALRFLEEGKELVDKDPVQASEKLYKAAEETVKALAIHFNLVNIIKSVDERGRWTVTDLERAALEISRKLGRWFRATWDAANYLHVWGFHGAKINAEDIDDRLPDIERMVKEAQEIISGAHDS
ncbi:MAG: PaREP1 family protein [Caldivirga sp.]